MPAIMNHPYRETFREAPVDGGRGRGPLLRGQARPPVPGAAAGGPAARGVQSA